jgi:hypothetical protein
LELRDQSKGNNTTISESPAVDSCAETAMNKKYEQLTTRNQVTQECVK